MSQLVLEHTRLKRIPLVCAAESELCYSEQYLKGSLRKGLSILSSKAFPEQLQLDRDNSETSTEKGHTINMINMILPRCANQSTLLSSTALVLESLHFKSDQQCSDVDVGFWIITAVKRGLREPSRLPQSLYTCGTLVVLKLQNVSLVDVQFKRALHLDEVIFLDDRNSKEDIIMLPYSEILDLVRAENDNLGSFSIMVPSLQRFD
ncbi:hypothetical protein F2Q69_00001158 [Brassica cretica]|uniref:Uncharacterized protein n=1 Tax=Brassica cretica TaxID=69181 RepID=A0A8S9P355_BRACR|nr:hypothetical protein F2Q69_00001158 [Brassica cretica]